MVGLIVACSVMWNGVPMKAVGEVVQKVGHYDVKVDFRPFFKEMGLDKLSQDGILVVNHNNCFYIEEKK